MPRISKPSHTVNHKLLVIFLFLFVSVSSFYIGYKVRYFPSLSEHLDQNNSYNKWGTYVNNDFQVQIPPDMEIIEDSSPINGSDVNIKRWSSFTVNYKTGGDCCFMITKNNKEDMDKLMSISGSQFGDARRELRSNITIFDRPAVLVTVTVDTHHYKKILKETGFILSEDLNYTDWASQYVFVPDGEYVYELGGDDRWLFTHFYQSFRLK